MIKFLWNKGRLSRGEAFMIGDHVRPLFFRVRVVPLLGATHGEPIFTRVQLVPFAFPGVVNPGVVNPG
jgi:hypothetical protein